MINIIAFNFFTIKCKISIQKIQLLIDKDTLFSILLKS